MRPAPHRPTKDRQPPDTPFAPAIGNSGAMENEGASDNPGPMTRSTPDRPQAAPTKTFESKHRPPLAAGLMTSHCPLPRRDHSGSLMPFPA